MRVLGWFTMPGLSLRFWKTMWHHLFPSFPYFSKNLNFWIFRPDRIGFCRNMPIVIYVDATSGFLRNMYLCPDLCCVILSQLPPDLERGWMVQNSEFDTAHIFPISFQNSLLGHFCWNRKKFWLITMPKKVYFSRLCIYREEYPNIYSLSAGWFIGQKAVSCPSQRKSLKIE